MKNVLHGDLGYSMKYESRMLTVLLLTHSHTQQTWESVHCAGTVLRTDPWNCSSTESRKETDFVCILIAIIGTSIPDFIMGSVLQYFFGIKWQILPVAQYTSFKHTILPSIAVGFYTLASISRLMRSSMLEVVSSDYTKTARAKGLSISELHLNIRSVMRSHRSLPLWDRQLHLY